MRTVRFRNRGFTLLELMVALGISCLLLVLSGTVLRAVVHEYEWSDENATAMHEADLVFAQLRMDLAASVHWGDGCLSEDPKVRLFDRFGFQVLQPRWVQKEDRWVGDLAAVVYQPLDRQIDGRVVRCLSRGFRDSRTVCQSMIDGSLARSWECQLDDEALGHGIVSFRVRPLSEGPSGALQDWDPEQSDAPDAVDVTIAILSGVGMKRLRSSADWDRLAATIDPDDIRSRRDLIVRRTRIRAGHPDQP